MQEWMTKSFKSGNSVALRLPKGLGFVEGEDVAIVPHEDGSFTFWKAADDGTILDRLFGSFSESFMAAGRGDIEQGDRSWDIPDTRGQAA